MSEFQNACNVWEEFTGVKFQRTMNEEESNFIIRAATEIEEVEKHKLVAEAFFWSSQNKKVLAVWKIIKDWNAYSVFLHEVGHILGFRHEHVFLSESERNVIGTSESATGYELLQNTNVADTKSIMSYGYLSQFSLTNKAGCAELSDTDKSQATNYYKGF